MGKVPKPEEPVIHSAPKEWVWTCSEFITSGCDFTTTFSPSPRGGEEYEGGIRTHLTGEPHWLREAVAETWSNNALKVAVARWEELER
ncbi:ATP12 chaperone [Pseudohyphozyma bogoriensis]|nr:ATP12 chaperone [Pseudohyphozyma bogoriensis]